MIYFMKYSNSKPKRIRTEYALDFYQVWFGNESGQKLFDNGTEKAMPNVHQFKLWGEEIVESVWFKKILVGEVEEGYVQFDGTFEGTTDSWNLD